MKKVITHKNMLFIESCTFILAIIVIIFASNYASIYIRMLPLLFTCGVIGNIIFKRPVVTSVYGIAVSMCILYSTKSYSLYQILVLSIFDGINIGLGEIFGKYLKNIIIYLKNNDKKVSKKLLNKSGIYAIVILLVSVCINEYVYGNLFSYLNCKKNLQLYLKKTYLSTKILDARYSFFNNPKYTFKVKHLDKGSVYKYTIYLSDKKLVSDGYQESLKLENNSKLNKELMNFVKESKMKDLDINGEYKADGNIELTINRKIQKEGYTLQDFSKCMAGIIKQLQEKFNNKIVRVKLNLVLNKDNYSTIIYYDQKIDNLYEYILKSFDTEYINN